MGTFEEDRKKMIVDFWIWFRKYKTVIDTVAISTLLRDVNEQCKDSS